MHLIIEIMCFLVASIAVATAVGAVAGALMVHLQRSAAARIVTTDQARVDRSSAGSDRSHLVPS